MERMTNPLVVSVKELCRVCYTCVRECPAKAIRIEQGQAEVMSERCIGCGNCVNVCSQNAKKIYSSIDAVTGLLKNGRKAAALIAPSFPAEFCEFDYQTLCGMLKAIGFGSVHEVAFGAELVAAAYKTILEENPSKQYIATTCPAIVRYIEYYFPELVKNLVPIVSPMIAAARSLRHIHGSDLQIVFIGPCIAKKGEAPTCGDSVDVINGALTFGELRHIFLEEGILATQVKRSFFDPPYAGKARLFALSRGLLESAGIAEDLISSAIVSASGREDFHQALKEFEQGTLSVRLLELLCCKGCIMGAGMSKKNVPLFQRRFAISRYVQQRLVESTDNNRLDSALQSVNLSRTFAANDQRIAAPSSQLLSEILNKMGKDSLDDELNCGACGYETCREHAVAISKGLAESEMCLPYTIDQLKKTVQQLADSNETVVSIQHALMQSEKLASMGQLAAGIAHEVNNPLGVVLMYAHLLMERCENNESLRDDLKVIVEQSDRCKRIVSGLLNFARKNKVLYQETRLIGLVNHTVKSLNIPSRITVVVNDKMSCPTVEIDQNQISQVLINLITNAIDAMENQGTLTIEMGDAANESFYLRVSDTGIGIPKENLSKIFEPFFTTKQIGKGTGLGLAVLYGIVKMHRGSVKVTSTTDPAVGLCGSTFTITIPRKEIL
ncbi:MAG: 4Fe-4S binding protein [Chitinivibrionales bacterium]|nr:4Fe-4S binding protein [Chitinivibrionales bacterium]